MSDFLKCAYEPYQKKQFFKHIADRLNGRKLVLRWKSKAFEEQLWNELQIKPAFYISSNPDRIDNVETFPESIITGKADEYFIVVSEKQPYSIKDEKRYKNAGFHKNDDVVWFNPSYRKEVEADSTRFSYSDIYGNTVESESMGKFIFEGENSHVLVGKNVKLPKRCIVLESNTVLHIGDNCELTQASVDLMDGSKMLLDCDISMKGISFWINSLSTVEIGEKTTLQTGRIRTGRNQKIIIGRDCMFSWDIVTLSHDGHLIFDLREGTYINNTNGEQRLSIEIGDHVWVGGEVALLPMTKIGNGSICGYRSLVKGEFPNNCAIAGSPAKIVKRDIAWQRRNFASSDEEINDLAEEYRRFTEDCQKEGDVHGL